MATALRHSGLLLNLGEEALGWDHEQPQATLTLAGPIPRALVLILSHPRVTDTASAERQRTTGTETG
jgi:hypothetical protein